MIWLLNLLAGTAVFAMWQDRTFYPGHITSTASKGRYTVRYEDGASRTVKECDMVVCELLPIGQAIMMDAMDEWAVAAEVVGHDKVGGKVVHLVRREDEEEGEIHR